MFVEHIDAFQTVGVDRTPQRDITSAWYLFGGAAFLYGQHSRILLFVSTIAILAYTGFTGEHFADSVGWPVGLIAFGLFMIGLSAMAFRIDRVYVRGKGGRGAVSG